ncbi:MAG: GNAT family N-acetyltransferase [Anaerolineales bacterium]|nr:GNAT family N-acetyltransferase [Anaerolineales bacterium]
MSEVIIRKYQKADQPGVENVCYRTGYMGEGLDGRNLFNDKRLFTLLFNLYYAHFEPEHYFVAVDPKTDQAIGYICGTTDTEAQEKRLTRKIVPRILLRATFYTSWRHPESFRILRAMAKSAGQFTGSALAEIKQTYPAHLHIDILPEYQRIGLGTRLMDTFEDHLRAHGVKGVHLGTSNQNYKALPFYEKRGFQLVYEMPAQLWPEVSGLKTLFFAKCL